jgi:hypothetical protein
VTLPVLVPVRLIGQPTLSGALSHDVGASARLMPLTTFRSSNS